MREVLQPGLARRFGQLPADSMLDTPMRTDFPGGAELDSSDETPLHVDVSGIVPVEATPNKQSLYPHDLTLGTPARLHPLTVDTSAIDTPMREYATYNKQRQQHHTYDDLIDTPMRQSSSYGCTVDTPMQMDRRRAQSLIESSANREHLHNASIDTPMKEAMKMNSNEVFYSPPTKHRSQPASHATHSESFTDNSSRLNQAVSRHGTASIHPKAISRHGTVTTAGTDQPLDLSGSAGRLVRAPYEHEPSHDKPSTPTTPGGTYKLNTPYGNADNEVTPDSNISLSTAMDAIRSNMKQQISEPAPSNNLAFGQTSLPQTTYNSPSATAEHQQPSPSLSYKQEPSLGANRRVSSGSSEIESAFADIDYNYSPHGAPVNMTSSAPTPTTSVPVMSRRASAENDDRASVHSYSSGK